MALKQEVQSFHASSRQAWRKWLEENHATKQAVWLVYYKKQTGVPTVTYPEAVDEALCFGWIDSTRRSLGAHQFTQLFAKRKPTGTWSKINKDKVKQLIEAGLMRQAGLDSIAVAKQNGAWNILNDVDALKIPDDLQAAFNNHAGSQAFFDGLSNSARKAILQWLILAKQPETRQRRINEIAELAAQKLKPKQFR